MAATEPADFHQPQVQNIYGCFLQPDVLKTWRFVNLTFCKPDVLQTWRFRHFETGRFETWRFVGVPVIHCIWSDSEPSKFVDHPRGPQTDEHLPQGPFTGQFFKKNRHLGIGVFVVICSMSKWCKSDKIFPFVQISQTCKTSYFVILTYSEKV
jgi:hypothetical protein